MGGVEDLVGVCWAGANRGGVNLDSIFSNFSRSFRFSEAVPSILCLIRLSTCCCSTFICFTRSSRNGRRAEGDLMKELPCMFSGNYVLR